MQKSAPESLPEHGSSSGAEGPVYNRYCNGLAEENQPIGTGQG
jgi:hypothetical protein